MRFHKTTVPKLPEGFKDATYQNDICIHYEKLWNSYIVEVWIAEDNPERRENIHQYMVSIREPFESEHIEYIEFSIEDFSQEGLRIASRRIHNEVYKLMKKYKEK